MGVFHPFPPLPPHPPNNHSWGDWVRFTSTGGGDTPYNGVYGEAPPERGIGKSIIWVCERAKELTDDFYGFIKLKKCSIFVMDSYLKDSAFTAAKRMQSVLSKVCERGTICKGRFTGYDFSARSVGPTVSERKSYMYFDTRFTADSWKRKSARFRKSVAVQQIFVQSGQHFQRSRHVDQNLEQRACV